MTAKIKRGKTVFWVDRKGKEKPQSHVSIRDKKREALIDKVLGKVLKEQARLSKFKTEIRKMIQKYLDDFAYEFAENWKGNATITNYDQSLKIEIGLNEDLTFDEGIQIAKQIIDNCIAEWSETSNNNVKALVSDAFNVGSNRKLNTRSILALRRHKMHDPSGKWKKAMDLISDSIVVQSSKEYIRFYERTPSGGWKQISLQFSAL